MVDLSKAISFKEYLAKTKEDYGDTQEKTYNNTKLSDFAKKQMDNLKEPVNAVVFTEGFCPDCIVTIPFIEKLSEYNNNLKVSYLPRKGFESFLEAAVGSIAIPTIITFDKDMNPKGAYVEIPKAIKEKLCELPLNERKNIINEYRDGKFNNEIEKDLLDIIL